ncbi:MAG: hypothetical protein BWZ11_00634 [Bacteroidetes bacterium ADurb.BinA395]|nr:MAG: hypothetical protein BWZ11_00634 [Bacteroidetes bacterium ADurb.BinA395]
MILKSNKSDKKVFLKKLNISFMNILYLACQKKSYLRRIYFLNSQIRNYFFLFENRSFNSFTTSSVIS